MNVNEIKIDTDVPMPAHKLGRKAQWPWDKLTQVGFSFFAPEATMSAMSSNVYARNAASGADGPKFRVFPETQNGVKGVRVYRVKPEDVVTRARRVAKIVKAASTKASKAKGKAVKPSKVKTPKAAKSAKPATAKALKVSRVRPGKGGKAETVVIPAPQAPVVADTA